MYRCISSLGLYVNTEPLLISSRVIRAARSFDPLTELKWNDQGYVCGVSYDLAMGIAKELDICVLSLRDYVRIAREVPEVMSSDFAEWLSDTYVFEQGDKTPKHYPDTNLLRKSSSASEKVLRTTSGKLEIPVGRPGWFDFASLGEDGLPTRLNETSQPGDWKFWSLEATEHTSGALRNFVTSSGTCSLDLGIPVFARHPKIMMRECYKSLAPPSPSPIMVVWEEYEKLTQSRNDNAIRSFLGSIDLDGLHSSHAADEFIACKEMEMHIDMKGKQTLLAHCTGTLPKIERAHMIDVLQKTPDDETLYVVGHPRPDSDSVISAIFEAIRRNLKYPPRTCLPWTESVPREVQHLLGLEATTKLSKIPAPGSQHDIVLVDCHQVATERQTNVKAIIDHHIIRRRYPYYVEMSHEVSWSSTLQVYVKILGSGWELSPQLAKILLDATTLEAEPALLVYMSEIDRLSIERLKHVARHIPCYNSLMAIMVDEASIEEMFYRDYRQTSYGFAVVKTQISRDYTKIAEGNNSKKRLPLTVVKEIAYSGKFEIIRTEKIWFIFNSDFHDKGFRNAVSQTVYDACNRFHKHRWISKKAGMIEIGQPMHQTPRLLLQPLIEILVEEHLKFVYATSIGRYLAMGFYSGIEAVYGIPGEDMHICTSVSYNEVKAILENSEVSMLSLPEYWAVYHELHHRGHTYALRSLADANYVELLATEIEDCQTIRSGSESTSVSHIESASPALICPTESYHPTGIPKNLRRPDTYDDPSLWRYWSPDSKHNVSTRGHIFVMNQTSIDLEMRPDEKTKNLTFRRVYRDIPDLRFEVKSDGENWVKVVIKPRLFSVYSQPNSGYANS
jgi:hypothetical protein